MRQEDYDKKIREVAKENSNNSSLKGIPTGKILYHTFENLFYLQHEVNHLFINKPTFSKYTEADEIYKRRSLAISSLVICRISPKRSRR